MLRSLLAALLLAANPLHAAEMRNPDAYVHLTTRRWLTLDPAAAFDAVSYIVTGNVYEPLLAFKSLRDCDTFEPFLADRVPTRENGGISPDGLTYRFRIREGVRFHDGAELTPEDVRYSLLRFMLTDAQGGPAALLLKPVLGVYTTRGEGGAPTIDPRRALDSVRVDGRDVVVRLAAPDATFLKTVASLPIVVSKTYSIAHGEWDGGADTWLKFRDRPVAHSHYHAAANGTGAFKLAKQMDGDQLALARHDGYWRQPAKLAEVYLRVVGSKSMRIWMLENGDADAGYFEDRDFLLFDDIDGVARHENLPYATLGEVVFFNFDIAPDSQMIGSGKLDGAGIPPNFFADPDVRKGFAYALDYETYLRQGLHMRGERATGPIPSYLLPARAAAPYDFDLKKAEKHLRKAFDGELWDKGFQATLTYSTSNRSRIVIAKLLRKALKDLNEKFVLRIQPSKSADLYARAEAGRLALFIAGYYADYPDPHSYAFGMLHSAGYYPRAQRYADADIDRLLEQAAGETHLKRRRRLYRKAIDIAARDAVQIYTYYPKRFTAAREWVAGFDDDGNVANLRLNNFPYFYALSKKR